MIPLLLDLEEKMLEKLIKMENGKVIKKWNKKYVDEFNAPLTDAIKKTQILLLKKNLDVYLKFKKILTGIPREI